MHLLSSAKTKGSWTYVVEEVWPGHSIDEEEEQQQQKEKFNS